MNFNAVTASCLQHPPKSTELTYQTREKALAEAEFFTSVGFEVTTPVSYDGETWTIVVTR